MIELNSIVHMLFDEFLYEQLVDHLKILYQIDFLELTIMVSFGKITSNTLQTHARKSTYY